jgi:hypothetical protein
MRKKILISLAIFLLLTACTFIQNLFTPATPTRDYPPEVQTDIASAHQPTPTFLAEIPTLAEYPDPNLQLDMSPFEDAGCPAGENGFRICTEDSPLYALGCWQLKQPNDVTAGLIPSLPLALCELIDRSYDPEPAHLYNYGCSRPSYMSVVIKEEGGYRLVSTIEDLQVLYAPIDTPEKALAYAVAATGYRPAYHMEEDLDPSFRFFTTVLEETHVIKEDDGSYRVNLFFYRLCGCGPHGEYQFIVHVTQNGEIGVDEPQVLWEDPSQDGMCVD